MTKYKHVIWDWNGTLLDDVWLCVEIINSLLAERNLCGLTHRHYQSIFDVPVKSYYEKAGFDLTAESFDSLCREFCDRYAARVIECDLHHNALNTLKFCSENGIVQSILSSAEQIRLEQMIHTYGLNHFFNKIIGQGDTYANGKIESGIHFVNGVNLDKNEILLIGDTTHDQQVAQKMGIDCALVSVGHHPAAKLEKTGASVFDNLSEIVHLLKNGHGA